MKWALCSFRFKPRRAIFVLPVKDLLAVELSGKFELMGLGFISDELPEFLLKKLLQERPELSGCVLDFLEFCYSPQCWKLGVSHSTLPETQEGYEAEQFPLRKNAWAKESEDAN